MDTAITVGMLVWWILGALVVVGLVGAVLFFLSVIADGLKH
jgi:hypothetical protein